MLTISRLLASNIVTVLRRAMNLTNRQLGTQLVHVIAGHEGLTIRAHNARFAVEYHQSVSLPPISLVLPLDFLQAISGRKDTTVTIAQTADGNLTATWQEGAIPQQRSTAPLELSSDQPFPPLPESLAENPPDVLQLLRDAVAVTDQESSRYALGCLQFRGRDGSVAATDGRQILKQSGLRLGFDEELLVAGSKVFGCAQLDSSDKVSIGKTDTHVAFRTRPWTIWLPIEKGARFPRIDDVIPSLSTCRSTVTLAYHDRRFLADSLPQLPCDDPQHEPVTLDLNGRVLVRARGSADGPVTELVLSNSSKSGDDMRLATNRKFLSTALRMGFEQLHLVDAASPALAMDERRRYVWAVLDKDSQLAPTDNATVVASPVPATGVATARRARVNPCATTTAPARYTAKPRPKPIDMSQRTGPSSKKSPIEQVGQLRQALRAASTQAAELLRMLKQRKKHERVVKSTLASLRQLQGAI